MRSFSSRFFQHGISAPFPRYMRHSLSLVSRLISFAPSFLLFASSSSTSPPPLTQDEISHDTDDPPSLPPSLTKQPQIRNNNPPRHRTRSRADLTEDIEYERGHWGAADCALLCLFFALFFDGIFGFVLRFLVSARVFAVGPHCHETRFDGEWTSDFPLFSTYGIPPCGERYTHTSTVSTISVHFHYGSRL